MRDSYLGLADRSGLRLLIPEREHVSRFLTRRALRESSVCLWAVIDTVHHQAISAELLSGEWLNALCLLELLAVDFGICTLTDPIPAHAIANT